MESAGISTWSYDSRMSYRHMQSAGLIGRIGRISKVWCVHAAWKVERIPTIGTKVWIGWYR